MLPGTPTVPLPLHHLLNQGAQGAMAEPMGEHGGSGPAEPGRRGWGGLTANMAQAGRAAGIKGWSRQGKMAGMKRLGTSPGWKRASGSSARGRRRFPLRKAVLGAAGALWPLPFPAQGCVPCPGLEHLFLSKVRGGSGEALSGPAALVSCVLMPEAVPQPPVP